MSTSGGYKVFITPETATWGSIATPTWLLLPVEPASLLDVVETLFDDARRGQAVEGFRQLEGVHRTDFSLSGPAYPNEIAHMIRSLIGPDTLIGTAAPYSHVFDVVSMATAAGRSFQIQALDDSLGGGESYTHEGCVATGLTFRFNAASGMLTYEANILGRGMVTTTAQAAVSDATDEPMRGWHANVLTSVGLGTGITGRLIEGEISIARPGDLLYVANNNKFPVRLHPGLVAVTGRFTASFDDLDNANLYRNLTNEALILEFAYGAGASLRSIDFEFPKASYGDSPAEIDRSSSNMTIAYNFRGLLGTTSSTLGASGVSTNVRMRMRNAVTAAYAADT